jgi:hypothetical protein
MAAIVGVHGIGKYRYYLDAGRSATGAAEAMRAKWNRYLHAGLTGGGRHGGQSYVAEVAYYAHHLNRDRGGRPRAVRSPVEAMDASAQQVFVAWARQLEGLRDTAGESLTGTLRRLTGWMLDRMEGRAVDFAGRFCPEVAAYLTQDAARERCRDVVAEVIRRNRPKVVIAHSLGSVVAYEALHAHPDLDVELLITLGSPLGMRGVVFERLLPVPVNGLGVRPGGVRRWVNIADRHDIAAIPPALRDRFTGVDHDGLVNLDWIDFHTVEKYLGCGALNDHLRPYVP